MRDSSLWYKVSHLGVRPDARAEQKKLIILSNRLTVLLISLLLPFYPFQAFVLQAPAKAQSSLLLALTLVLVLFLNRFSLFLPARLLIAIATPLSVYIASIATKLMAVNASLPVSFIDYVEPRIFILCVVGLPVLLFDMKREKAFIVALYTFYALLLLGFDVVHERLGIGIQQQSIDFSNKITMLLSPTLALTSLVGAYWFLKQLNESFEDQLSLQNENLRAAEEELRQNFEEMQTVQERLEIQEKQLQKVFETLPNATLVKMMPHHLVVMANQKALNFLEKNGDSIIGMTWKARYADPTIQESVEEHLKKHGYLDGLEAQMLDKSGHSHWMSISVSSIVMNGQPHQLFSFTDVEEQHLNRQEIVEKNAKLAQKNEELLTMDEELRQNLEELQSQRDFIEHTNRQIHERNQSLELFNRVLIGLSKHASVQQGDWDQAMEAITLAVSNTLGIQRVSIWEYQRKHASIYCEKLFSQNGYSAGMTLYGKNFPHYFQALLEERLIVANDAVTHPDTQEFAETYLLPLKIASMIDAPFFAGGKLRGIICCEYQGDIREWAPEEIAFVKAISDIIAIAHNNYLRAKAKEYILQSTTLLTKLARNEHLATGRFDEFLAELTQSATSHTTISRISVWKYEKQQKVAQIKCLKLYETDGKRFSEGAVLSQADFPEYFKALETLQPIVATDARRHTATQQFTASYFEPLNIYSLLDVPYFINGQIEGVICCEYQHEIKEWTPELQVFVKSLADLVTVAHQNSHQRVQQQELQTRNEDLERVQAELNQNMEALQYAQAILKAQKDKLDREYSNTLNSIEYAQTIQKSILPSEQSLKEIFPQSFVIYRPKDIVSGDFYWASDHENNERLIATIDCTGHGVPGAFMSMIGHSLLAEIIMQKGFRNPAKILEELHLGVIRLLHQGEGFNDDGMDASVCLLRETPQGTWLAFAGAKQSIYCFSEGELKELRGTRRIIGGKTQRLQKPFEEQTLLISKGDMLYLASDGFQDQNNAARARYSSMRLKAKMEGMASFGIEQQQDGFLADLLQFSQNEPQRDDITLIGVRL